MKPMISIIVPVFNGAQSIHQCLLSILSQTYKDIEVIVVNDGSTDQTQTCVEALARHDQRIKLISQSNQGVAMARNQGLEAACGTYISFVDADDKIEPNFIEVLLQLAQNHDADIVECSVVLDTETHQNLRIESLPHQVLSMNDGLVKHFLSQTYVKNYVANKLFKTTLLQTCRFPKLAFGEDFVFLLNVFSKAKQYVSTSLPLYHYVIHASSATQSSFNLKQLDSIKAGEYALQERLVPLEFNSLISKYICEKIFFLYPKTTRFPNTFQRKEIQHFLRQQFKVHYPLITKDDYHWTRSEYRQKHYFLFNVHPMLVYGLIAINTRLKGK